MRVFGDFFQHPCGILYEKERFVDLIQRKEREAWQ